MFKDRLDNVKIALGNATSKAMKRPTVQPAVRVKAPVRAPLAKQKKADQMYKAMRERKFSAMA